MMFQNLTWRCMETRIRPLGTPDAHHQRVMETIHGDRAGQAIYRFFHSTPQERMPNHPLTHPQFLGILVLDAGLLTHFQVSQDNLVLYGLVLLAATHYMIQLLIAEFKTCRTITTTAEATYRRVSEHILSSLSAHERVEHAARLMEGGHAS